MPVSSISQYLGNQLMHILIKLAMFICVKNSQLLICSYYLKVGYTPQLKVIHGNRL